MLTFSLHVILRKNNGMACGCEKWHVVSLMSDIDMLNKTHTYEDNNDET